METKDGENAENKKRRTASSPSDDDDAMRKKAATEVAEVAPCVGGEHPKPRGPTPIGQMWNSSTGCWIPDPKYATTAASSKGKSPACGAAASAGGDATSPTLDEIAAALDGAGDSMPALVPAPPDALRMMSQLDTGGHALREAADQNDVVEIQRLLAAGVDVNDLDRDGWSALMMAAGNCHVEAVKALLAAGADARVKEPLCGWSAQTLAERSQREGRNVVILLLTPPILLLPSPLMVPAVDVVPADPSSVPAQAPASAIAGTPLQTRGSDPAPESASTPGGGGTEGASAALATPATAGKCVMPECAKKTLAMTTAPTAEASETSMALDLDLDGTEGRGGKECLECSESQPCHAGPVKAASDSPTRPQFPLGAA